MGVPNGVSSGTPSGAYLGIADRLCRQGQGSQVVHMVLATRKGSQMGSQMGPFRGPKWGYS